MKEKHIICFLTIVDIHRFRCIKQSFVLDKEYIALIYYRGSLERTK